MGGKQKKKSHASSAKATTQAPDEGAHRKSQKSGAGPSALDNGDEGNAGVDLLFYLRTKYTLLGKAEWWWLMDESLAEINRRLATENFVVIDNFLPREDTRALRSEVKRAHDEGHLQPGVLAGGKAGNSTQYTMKDVRGDHVGWFNGNEPELEWKGLPAAMKKTDTLVNELGQLGGEARHVSSRSKAMCTVYPGAGARYIRHVDNPDKNGRLLTALLYLNVDWEEGDGGELRVFRCLKNPSDAAGFTDCDGRSLEQVDTFDTSVTTANEAADLVKSGARDVAEGVREVAVLHKNSEGEEEGAKMPVHLTDVAPLGGRLVLFKSDARVPHEVLAAKAPRYAVTLWYFHKQEVTAARAAPLTEEEHAAQEAKIAREIEAMKLKYGGTDTDVKVRESQKDQWREAEGVSGASGVPTGSEVESGGANGAPPAVPPPCEAAWEVGSGEGDVMRTLAVCVPLPAGTGAGDCNAEVETSSDFGGGSHLIIEAPGLPGGAARIQLPLGADDNSIAIKLVKKPKRALVVRISCPAPSPPPRAAEPSVPPPPHPPRPAAVRTAEPPSRGAGEQIPQKSAVAGKVTSLAGKDCVGVGGTLSWTSSTDFSPIPSMPPPARNVAPRGVDLRDANDWEDYIQTRWAIAGCNDQPVITPHTLDGLSFPVTLAWALQQRPVIDAIAAARAAAVPTAADDALSAAVAAGAAGDVTSGAASIGDGAAGSVPTTVIVAGASAFTEQFLLDHTSYWEEVTASAPQPRGGVHLAFVGPDVRRSGGGLKRLSRSLTASVHKETVREYLNRLPTTAPLLVMGFNTGMGGGGGALARSWSADLVDVLRRPGVPAVFTAANDYADLRGELAVFKALGARFILDPRSNPLRAYTHTIAEGDGRAGIRSRPSPAGEGAASGEKWSCANAFVYAVSGFQPGKGLDGGLSEAQLCALAAAAAERAAGAAWDALGMRR